MTNGRTVSSRISGAALPQAVQLLVRHRHLIWLLAIRELRDRYAGSVLGIGWALFQPLLLMVVMIIVLGSALAPRAGGAAGSAFDYASYVVAGYLPWVVIAASLQASSAVIINNPGLVKQIDFPLEVLPVKTVIAQLVPQLTGVAGLIAYDFAARRQISALLPLLPLLIGVQLTLISGLCWLVAALGAYFRDIEQILQSLLLMNLYMLPIFLPPEATPRILQPIIACNPFSPVVWVFQDVLFYGEYRHPAAWGVFLASSVLSFVGGFAVFRRAKWGFGNLV
jgi:lipopolysaccharide transport system permease protein